MRKFIILIAVVFIADQRVSPALAVERKHRPWFSSAGKEAPLLPSKVGMRDGQRWSIAQNHPSPSSSPLKGEEITQQTLKYRGTRYQFGGTSKKGVDCSGLIARVWDDLNMNKVPRKSSQLYQSGKPVHLSQLQPGDLVFFKNTYKRGVSHVGVYAGQNKFIHASGRRKGVTVTKLSDPYYQLHYAGARRLY